jgi:hypothetical protein
MHFKNLIVHYKKIPTNCIVELKNEWMFDEIINSVFIFVKNEWNFSSYYSWKKIMHQIGPTLLFTYLHNHFF